MFIISNIERTILLINMMSFSIKKVKNFNIIHFILYPYDGYEGARQIDYILFFVNDLKSTGYIFLLLCFF